jgi:hypothetical protein
MTTRFDARFTRRSQHVPVFAATLGLALAACRSTGQAGPSEPEPRTPLEEVLAGVRDPKMRGLWRNAHAQGQLPPIEAVPRPPAGSAVEDASRGFVKESATGGKRPILTEGVVADAQPYSATHVAEYAGPLVVTKVAPGLVVGRLAKLEGAPEMELHYRLLGPSNELAVEKGAELELMLRDEVQANSLERRIVLHDAKGRLLFALLSEGGDGAYRTVLERSGLTVEQLAADQPSGQAPVRVSLGGSSVTLTRGQRGLLGDRTEGLQVFVHESLARSPAQTLVSEGHNNYVRVLIQRAK